MMITVLNRIRSFLYTRYLRSPLFYNNSGLIVVCCIAKQENEYIREWVEYHLSIGFDRIYIYDNNDIDGERFEDVIGDYIKSGYIEIIDFRGRTQCQTLAYNDCYKCHDNIDWFVFIDCDEFFTIVDGTSNVHNLLYSKKYLPYQLLHVNWMVYDDNNLLDNDGRKVIERFQNPHLPFDYKKPNSWHSFPDNYHIKSFVRGGLKHIDWQHALSPHTPKSCIYRCGNFSGKECDPNSPFTPYDYSVAYLRHYTTKSIGEFMRHKMKRGFPDQPKDKAFEKLTIDNFFYINERTEEKLRYIEKLKQQL